jgi:hypothetical protein
MVLREGMEGMEERAEVREPLDSIVMMEETAELEV